MHLPFQYGTSRNFCGVPSYVDQPFVVLGAPVDCVTTFRSGARMGPNAIRDVSMMLTDGVHARYPVTLSEHVGDAGDMPIPSGYHAQAHDVIQSCVHSFQGKHVVTLGGDHSITRAILSALAQSHDQIAVVHFDAHCDTWHDHFGMAHGHGTWLRDVIENGLVHAPNVISIGVRSPADAHARNYLHSQGGTTLSAREAHKMCAKQMAHIIRNKVGHMHTYLSLDIDCLDPAHAPGTGTPEIGGLTTMWLQEVLEELPDVNWIGMDCVEVSPCHDVSQITALAAATFVWQYLCMNITKHTAP